MLVNAATLGAINTGFNVITMQNLKKPEDLALVGALSNVTRSTKGEEQYNWLMRLGRVREWIGPRVLNRFKAYGYSIRNKKWESSVEVSADDIADDQLNQYVPQIQTMATEMNDHYVRLLTAVLEAGFVELAYDGQAFFDTDHPVGGRTVTTVANKTTAALSRASLEAAFNNLVNLRDDRDDLLGIVYDTLFVHHSKRFEVTEMLEAEFTFSGGNISGYNRTRGLIPNVVYLDHLTDPDKWFLMDSRKPIKPLILQIRQAPVFQSVTNLNDSQVFDTDNFKFGVKARHNAGYSLWQLMYAGDGTA